MRRKIMCSTIVISALLAFGCGTKNQDNSNENPQEVTDAALASEFENLPDGVMIKVPVDGDKELTDQAEMRLVNGTVTEDTADEAFASASAPESVLSGDELDTDSSVNSWQDWRQGQGRTTNSNYTDIDVRNSRNTNINVNNNITNNYFGSNYSPRAYSLVNTRSYFRYQRPTCWKTYRSYRYYYYPRPRCRVRWCHTQGRFGQSRYW